MCLLGHDEVVNHRLGAAGGAASATPTLVLLLLLLLVTRARHNEAIQHAPGWPRRPGKRR